MKPYTIAFLNKNTRLSEPQARFGTFDGIACAAQIAPLKTLHHIGSYSDGVLSLRTTVWSATFEGLKWDGIH
jgi:hypothetical protein